MTSKMDFLDRVCRRYQEAAQDAAFANSSCRTKKTRFVLVIRSSKPNMSHWHFNKSSPHVQCTLEHSNIVIIKIVLQAENTI